MHKSEQQRTLSRQPMWTGFVNESASASCKVIALRYTRKDVRCTNECVSTERLRCFSQRNSKSNSLIHFDTGAYFFFAMGCSWANTLFFLPHTVKPTLKGTSYISLPCSLLANTE